VLIEVPAGIGPDRLETALRTLMGHHDMLRARLVCGDERDSGSWRLDVPPAGGSVGDVLRRVDAVGLDADALADTVNVHEHAAASRLDPRAGVMLRAVWWDRGSAAPGRLLLVVHHLVVDGVSWRILVPDLAAAYAQTTPTHAEDTRPAGGEGIRPAEGVGLEPVGTSFRRWALLAQAQANDPVRVGELEGWREVLAGDGPALAGRELDPARDTAASMRRVSATVPVSVTGDLLTRLPALFHAGINDVLLAGLAAAVVAWRGSDGPLLVDVEGHGRQALADEVELSRTVGWFTNVYPVRLDPGHLDMADLTAGGPTAGQLIKRVKEQLRQTPGDGLGYGLLRYLNPTTGPTLAALPTPQISFNYLGRFGSASPAGAGERDDAHWHQIGLGGDAGDLPAAHTLEAGGAVRDGVDGPQLGLTLSWPEDLLPEPAVRRLVENWAQMLTGLAAHAAGPDAGGHTPSDFPLLELGQSQVEEFEAMAARIEKGASS
jgi:nonribosomal peptide synthetase CepB